MVIVDAWSLVFCSVRVAWQFRGLIMLLDSVHTRRSELRLLKNGIKCNRRVQILLQGRYVKKSENDAMIKLIMKQLLES